MVDSTQPRPDTARTGPERVIHLKKNPPSGRILQNAYELKILLEERGWGWRWKEGRWGGGGGEVASSDDHGDRSALSVKISTGPACMARGVGLSLCRA